MKIRDRTFSGASGVWFRRKKTTLRPSAPLPATSPGPWPSSSLNANNNNKKKKGRPVSSQTPVKRGKKQSESMCSQKCLVDWDDVRCRPVYEGRSSQNEDPENMDSLESDLDELDRKDNSSMVSSSSSTSQESYGKQNKLVKTRVSWLSHKRKKPDIVSQRGKRKFGSTRTTALVDITPPLTKKLEHKQKETAEEDHVHSSLASAAPTSLLRRSQKGTTATYTPAADFPETNLDFQENECEATIDTNCSSSDSKTPHQPTSKTSLSLARRFFQRLDSNHPLQMGRSDTAFKAFISNSLSTSPARETGRTQRSPLVSREQVCGKEYQTYCEACLVAGVKPLTLRTFLAQRSTFFDLSWRAYTGDGGNDEHGLP